MIGRPQALAIWQNDENFSETTKIKKLDKNNKNKLVKVIDVKKPGEAKIKMHFTATRRLMNRTDMRHGQCKQQSGISIDMTQSRLSL